MGVAKGMVAQYVSFSTSTGADFSAAALTGVNIGSLLGNKRTLITNPATNASPFRLGDATVSATRGLELGPGQTVEVFLIGTLFAFNTDAVAVQSITLLGFD